MIGHLMDVFVKHNDTSNTKCIMADKDFTERDIHLTHYSKRKTMLNTQEVGQSFIKLSGGITHFTSGDEN